MALSVAQVVRLNALRQDRRRIEKRMQNYAARYDKYRDAQHQAELAHEGVRAVRARRLMNEFRIMQVNCEIELSAVISETRRLENMR